MLGGIPDERQGVLNYRHGSKIIPRTERGNFSIVCRDELYEQLVPYHPWTVKLIPGEGGNDDFLGRIPFEVGIDEPLPPEGRPLESDLFFRWSMGKKPMYLNFSDPTINNLHKDPREFPLEKVVIPENYPKGHWIYMIITGNMTKDEQQDALRKFVPSAHPVSPTTRPFPPPLPFFNFKNRIFETNSPTTDASARSRFRPSPAIQRNMEQRQIQPQTQQPPTPGRCPIATFRLHRHRIQSR